MNPLKVTGQNMLKDLALGHGVLSIQPPKSHHYKINVHSLNKNVPYNKITKSHIISTAHNIPYFTFFQEFPVYCLGTTEFPPPTFN